jgi:hypothetical protein
VLLARRSVITLPRGAVLGVLTLRVLIGASPQIFPLVSMLCDACTRLFAGRAKNASTEERDKLYKMHYGDLALFRLAKDLGYNICSKA